VLMMPPLPGIALMNCVAVYVRVLVIRIFRELCQVKNALFVV